MVPLNYHHLYYFYVTAKAGSISKACKTLLLSQPTVSTQLKQLERELDRPLFERRKKRLHLTENGRTVLRYAERIFEIGQELKETLKDRPKNGRPAIKVGVAGGAPRALSRALIGCVLNGFSSAQVKVSEGGLSELLMELGAGQLDALLTDTRVARRGRAPLSSRLVGKVPIVLAAAPALARRQRKIPRDLQGAPFILPSWSKRVHAQTLGLLARWKVKPKVVAEAPDPELARKLAVSGLGIAPLLAPMVLRDASPNALTILKTPKAPGLHEPVYLVTKRRKFPHPVIAHLEKNFRLPLKARR